MKTSSEASCTRTMCTDHHFERLLNLYADGELPGGKQAELFAHLSMCAACREQFNVLLAFRLVSRQETFIVPPVVDEAVFHASTGFAAPRVSHRIAFRSTDSSADRFTGMCLSGQRSLRPSC